MASPDIVQCIKLCDRGDRIGSHLSWYISSILFAMKNKYKIIFEKPKSEYHCYKSIFIQSLFNFVDDYNESYFADSKEEKIIYESDDFFKKIINNILDIKSDLITAFKESIYTDKFREHLYTLAQSKNYTIPYNPEKTIVVHLRLDDRSHFFVNDNTRYVYSSRFKKIIDNDDKNFVFPGFVGQSAMAEDKIKKIIEKTLEIYKDYEVIIITNGKHTLPYKTICSDDDSYDLFLLSNATVLIGSMSNYSFSAILFGNYKHVAYPVWDHVVVFGLTTKYDRNTIIQYF
jgi:hypothetical protein